MTAITLKLVLAFVLGGMIGIEREFKRRPAGSRTHMLICMGATMTMIVNQEMILAGGNVDPGRIGAQVVAGIGFIGAGTIVVSHRHKVRGLTTAAGLWATAGIGLALGCGYYECGIAVTALVLFTETCLAGIDRLYSSKKREVSLYVEYEPQKGYVSQLMRLFQEKKISVADMEALKNGDKKCVLLFTLVLSKDMPEDEVVDAITGMEATMMAELL